MKAIGYKLFTKNYYAKHGLISVIGRLLSLPCAIFFNIMLARNLSPSDYGVIGIITQLISFLLILSMFGHRNIILKFVPDYIRKKEYHKVGNLLFQSIVTTITISVFFLIILNLFLENISNLYSLNKLELVIPLFSISLVFQTFNMILASLLVGVKKVWQSNISERTAMNVYYVITMLFLVKINFNFSLVNVACVFLSGKIVTCILLLIFSFPIIKKIGFSSIEFKSKNLFKLSSIFCSSELTIKIITAISPLIMALFLESDQIAYYYTAFLLANLASFFISMVNNLISNKISILFSDLEYQSILKLNIKTVKFLSLFSLLIVLIYVFFGKFILGFWGASYAEYSYFLLLILVTGEFINSFGGATGMIISLCDMEYSGFIITLVCAVFNLILQFLLIMNFGVIGAAFATALSVILYNFLKYYIVLNKFRKL